MANQASEICRHSTLYFFVDPLSKKDAFYTREKEIAEIESLIPEIKEKITDTKDMQQETVRKLGDRALLEERELESSSGPRTNGEGSTTNGFDAPPSVDAASVFNIPLGRLFRSRLKTFLYFS